MDKAKRQFVCVVGYGWSGSGAIVDLLSEFEENWDPKLEFRILKDPYGMMDLEHALLDTWEALNVDIAIKDFLDLAKFFDRNEGKFKRGLCYSNSFNGKFMDKTYEFINQIVDYEYKGFWWFFHYQAKYSKWLIKKIMNKLVKQKYEENMYFSDISQEEFYDAVRNYMNALVDAISTEKKYENIILDQGVPAQYPEKAFDYLDNAKVIIIDRDPRDIYCELVADEKLVGKDIAHTHDVFKFVKWHKKYREINQIQNENILRLYFEDAVLHYDETLERILKFIGDDHPCHSMKYEYFDPSISIQNIGKYKNFENQDEIRILERELSQYLYPLERD